MDPVISMRDVGVKFRLNRRNRRTRGGPRRWTKWGLRHVDLDVSHGEILGVIGPNGAGKSTLLRTVAGILRPDEGVLSVWGRVAPLVSPTGGLNPHLSGWENTELSTVLLGCSPAETRALLPQIAELSGLGEFMDAPTRVFSAGMRARLGFAMAVAVDPDVLVLDEMMAAADEEFRERSALVLGDFISRGRTVIFASHEVLAVADSCHRLVRLQDGRVVDDGAPGPIAARYRDEAHPSDPRVPAEQRRALASLVRDAVRSSQSARPGRGEGSVTPP